MTYSQKANPNATNSELDAKVIITPDDPYLYRNAKRIPEDFLLKSNECDYLIDILNRIKREDDNQLVQSIINKLGYLADFDDDNVILEVRK
tara:strand:+ start:203 stop:475 length:273 start_codon:yes stop_codon:yes gene_type:complete